VERFRRTGIDEFTPKVTRSKFRTGLLHLDCLKEVREKMTHHQERDQVAKSYDRLQSSQPSSTRLLATDEEPMYGLEH